ncbi:MAG: hypothetical protein ACKVOM_06550 [Ferruginibacter sp.]
MTTLKKFTTTLLLLFTAVAANAQLADNIIAANENSFGLWIMALLIIIPLLLIIAKLYYDFKQQVFENKAWKKEAVPIKFTQYLKNFDRKQVHAFVQLKSKKKCCGKCKDDGGCGKIKTAVLLAILFFNASNIFAQTASNKNLMSQPGIIITIVILLIPILLAAIFALTKANNAVRNYANTNKRKEAEEFAEYLTKMHDHSIEEELIKKDSLPDYKLTHSELAGTEKAEDTKGILSNISDKHATHFTATKRKAAIRPSLPPDITKLILCYIGCAAFWLVLGSGIGEYLGI